MNLIIVLVLLLVLVCVYRAVLVSVWMLRERAEEKAIKDVENKSLEIKTAERSQFLNRKKKVDNSQGSIAEHTQPRETACRR